MITYLELLTISELILSAKFFILSFLKNRFYLTFILYDLFIEFLLDDLSPTAKRNTKDNFLLSLAESPGEGLADSGRTRLSDYLYVRWSNGDFVK